MARYSDIVKEKDFEIKKLKEKLRVAMETLHEYADENNWAEGNNPSDLDTWMYCKNGYILAENTLKELGVK